jgi:uncharacterized protein YxjI
MKLSDKTIGVLKNFATINQSILIKDGSNLDTMSVQKNVLARYKVDEKFPREFGIYDLNEFLSTVSLFDKPELEFGETSVTITDGHSTTSYWYADKSIIVYPEKEITMPDCEVNFKLTADTFTKLQRATGTLGLNDLCIRNDGDKIVAEVQDKRNDTSNTYSVEVGDHTGDSDFKFYFLTERMKMLPNDYDIEISSKNISKFTCGELVYWVALESDSTYG